MWIVYWVRWVFMRPCSRALREDFDLCINSEGIVFVKPVKVLARDWNILIYDVPHTYMIVRFVTSFGIIDPDSIEIVHVWYARFYECYRKLNECSADKTHYYTIPVLYYDENPY